MTQAFMTRPREVAVLHVLVSTALVVPVIGACADTADAFAALSALGVPSSCAGFFPAAASTFGTDAATLCAMTSSELSATTASLGAPYTPPSGFTASEPIANYCGLTCQAASVYGVGCDAPIECADVPDAFASAASLGFPPNCADFFAVASVRWDSQTIETLCYQPGITTPTLLSTFKPPAGYNDFDPIRNYCGLT